MRIKSLKSLLALVGLVSLFTFGINNTVLAKEYQETEVADSTAAPVEGMEGEATAEAGSDAWPSMDEETRKLGKDLFVSKTCNSCHNIGRDGTGPNLEGVTSRREREWLYKWIRNNAALIAEGDPVAVEVSNLKPSAMNAFPKIKDEEIDAILAYIENGDVVAGGGDPTPPREAVDPVLAKRVNTSLLIIGFFILLIVILILEILNLVTRLTGKEIIKWNNVNAALMILFLVIGMAAAFWELYAHGPLLLPEATSEHGKEIDKMFDITFLFTGVVFVITQILLFGYAFIYRKRKGHKAYYYPHNNTLEVIWTVIPAIVLTVLVIYGLMTWDKIMYQEKNEDTQSFEIFAYQFGWKARTAGADTAFGEFNYNLISPTNPLGLGIVEEYNALVASLYNPKYGGKDTTQKPGLIQSLEAQIAKLEAKGNLTAEEEEELADLRETHHLKVRHLDRLQKLLTDDSTYAEKLFADAAYDDYIVEEVHVVVNKPVHLQFRARDVIHSAYLSYFRVQMNCVPGMPTEFTFVPTKTTAQMRLEKEDPEWDYYLICAKICGSSHNNMRMKFVVHESENDPEYIKWKEGIEPYFVQYTEPETPATTDSTATEVEVVGNEVALAQ